MIPHDTMRKLLDKTKEQRARELAALINKQAPKPAPSASATKKNRPAKEVK